MSNQNKKLNKSGRIVFHIIALTILILVLGINLDHQAQTIKKQDSAWYLQEVGQLIQYRTAGINQSKDNSTWVGIHNKPQQCEQNIFMLKFQSTNPSVKALSGQMARIQLTIGDHAASITLPIQISRSDDDKSFDIWLTNFVINEQLNKDLASNAKMTIRLLEPDVLIEVVPVNEMQFNLAGYVQTRSLAQTACHDRSNVADTAMTRYAVR